MSAKHAQDRRLRVLERRGVKAQRSLEAETTDTGSASDDSGPHQEVPMDLLWPSQPLPPGEIRRGQELPERCSLLPGQVFRKSQGQLPVGKVEPPEVDVDNLKEKHMNNVNQQKAKMNGCQTLNPNAKVRHGTSAVAPLKVQLPEILPSLRLDWSLPAKKYLPPFPDVSAEWMLFTQEVRLDPRMPVKKQLSEFLLQPTRFVT